MRKLPGGPTRQLAMLVTPATDDRIEAIKGAYWERDGVEYTTSDIVREAIKRMAESCAADEWLRAAPPTD